MINIIISLANNKDCESLLFVFLPQSLIGHRGTNIKLRGSSKNTFNTSNMMLLINQSSYTPLKKYNQYFEDF